MFAGSRAVVLVALWLASRLQPDLTMAGAVSRWDGGWYLLAADAGYPSEVAGGASTIAFFPLYPMLVRVASEVPGLTPIGAGVVVSGLSGLGAAVAIWILARSLVGEDAADRAVALFAFFPGSFVLSMVYAEATMLVLAAGCLWALVTRRWLVAGLLAAAATASRPNALALVAACGWASMTAIRARREWRSLVAPALAPAGVLAFFAFLWARTGEADAWFTTQRAGWGERIVPWALVDDLRQLAADPFVDMNNTVVVVGAAVALAGLVLLLRARLPGEVVVYTAAVLGMAFVSETLGSRPRFVLAAFPLFVAAAAHLRGTAFATVLAMSACTLGAFTVLSVTTTLATP